MKPGFARAAAASWVLAALSCGGFAGHAQDATDAEQNQPHAPSWAGQVVEEPETLKEPPPAGLAPSLSFPPVARQTLPNGLAVNYLFQAGLPLTRIVLTFASGTASEGSKLGSAQLGAQLVKFGGSARWSGPQVLGQLESFGSALDVSVGADHTTFELTVLNDDVQQALSLLAEIVSSPRLPYATFSELKKTQQAHASRNAHGDLAWANRVVLFRELFEVPASAHPYARYAALERELEPLSFADTKAWLDAHLSPHNARLILVGSLDAAKTMKLAITSFATWQGAEKPKPPTLDRPAGPDRFKVFLVEREDSPISEISLGVLGAPQKSAAWPALSVATHLLGVGPASRLFRRLNEREPLAIRAQATLVPLVGAPAVVTLNATCPEASTIAVAQALLDELERLAKEAPQASEVEHSVRAITSSFLNHENPQASLASMLAFEAHFDLAPDYYDAYHRELRELDAASIHETIKPYFDKDLSVLVVSGDTKLAPSLAKLAPVVVLDPAKDFSIKRRLDYAPL